MKISDKPRVVIAGANFAGLKAAVSLPKKFSVMVIDPHPWFEFLPNIHELVSGFKKPELLRLSKKDILDRAGHEYIMDAVVKIDPVNKKVFTRSGPPLSFDFCLIALGGENNTYGIKGADVNARSFKTVDDCHAIGRRLKSLAESRKPFSIVIVGGGFEGIETLGEILRKYKSHEGLAVHVVDSHHRLLNDAPADVDTQIRRICEPYPVSFHTNASVRRVWKHSVDLSGGIKLPSQLTVWTGGAVASNILYDAGLSPFPGQWAPVNSSLQALNHPDIFIAGDSAGHHNELSKQAYHALDTGKCAAENIAWMIAGKPLQPFKPSLKPKLVSFGDLDSYLITENTVIAGTALSAIKEAIYQIIMAEFDPSGLIKKVYHATGRAGTAAFDIALPMLFSPASLARLKNLRIIR